MLLPNGRVVNRYWLGQSYTMYVSGIIGPACRSCKDVQTK